MEGHQIPGYPILTVVTFLPIAAGALLLFVNRQKSTVIRWFSLLATVANAVLAVPLFTAYDRSTPAMQFIERASWIPTWNIEYYMGVDGISILFVMLSALVGILSVSISWTSVTEKVKEFHVSLLFLEGAMIGVFCSLDLFLFYVFWEAMLIPMYLMIGVWGGPNRVYAAIKFFLYTLVGSLLMLVGIITLYQTGGGTFDVLTLQSLALAKDLQIWLWLAFFAAFAVKVPMFPVHTWLPDAHTEAPTAGSVVLAAVLIKMGAYGFLRFSIPFFPDATITMMPAMLILSVVAIIYGAVICFAQTDLKRLIAYSSVSHMGFVTLGIFALNTQGLEGGILQMLNHGVVTGALFLLVGVVYERTHTRLIADYGGVASPAPVYATLFLIFTLAAVGLPSTNGFVGEFLILLGAFAKNRLIGALAALGVILGAGYMLWLYQKVFLQETGEKVVTLTDMNTREFLTLAPMIVLVFWIGVQPDTFLEFLHAPVQHLIERLEPAAEGMRLAGIVMGR